MNKFKAFIFDLDGTIINSHFFTTDFLQRVLKKYGNIELTENEVNKLFGPSERMIFMRFIDREKIDKCYEEYFNLFKVDINKINLFEGFPGVLESLGSAKKKLAIFTGRGRELTLYILKQKKLLKYFEIIVTSEDVENHKPYPDGVLKICGHFNLHPSAVLHIGDSPLDIACGKKAGVITGAALWGCKDKMALEEAKPDYIFHHPKDIERIIL